MKLRKSFYRALREAAGAFRWKIRDGAICATRGNQHYCPLTAVYYYRTGKFIEDSDAEQTNLLSKNDMGDIMYSADSTTYYLSNSQVACRKALARAVGVALEN